MSPDTSLEDSQLEACYLFFCLDKVCCDIAHSKICETRGPLQRWVSSDGPPRDSIRHSEGLLWQAAGNQVQVCSHANSPDKGSDVGAAPVHQVPPATDRECHNDAAADEIVRLQVQQEQQNVWSPADSDGGHNQRQSQESVS